MPWLDSRVRSKPAIPWSEENYQLDKRRAAAAGLHQLAGDDGELDRDTWQAAAETGHDIVGETAQVERERRLEAAQAAYDHHLSQSQAGEDHRRASALNDEVRDRAHRRVRQLEAKAGAGRNAFDSAHGQQSGELSLADELKAREHLRSANGGGPAL